MNLETICLEVVELAKRTGAFIQNERSKITNDVVEEKSINSLVTYVDKNAETQIVKALQEILPEAGFITEEETIAKTGDVYNWIIDPLDGTTNFIHGLPCYAVSIALTRHNQVIIGVIHEVNLKESFYAWENSKAYLNGTEINVSGSTTLKGSLIATGFPYYDYSQMDEYMALFRHLMQHTRGLRRLGSAATDLAYVACGRFDAFYEYSLHPWDVAAGILIVQQAGGKVSDFKGGEDYLFGKEIIASNPIIIKELTETVKKYFV